MKAEPIMPPMPPMLFERFRRGLLADEGVQFEERKKGMVVFKVVSLETSPEGDIMTLTGGGLWSPDSPGCRVLVTDDCHDIIPDHLRKRLLDPNDEVLVDLCFDLERATFQFIVYEPRDLSTSPLRH